jgi:YaiO family outer membrane protein
MLISLLLSLALTAGAQAESAQPAGARAQAEQLARSGSHREALERFQAIAAANPDDLEARVWIARLHALMGQHDRAIGVYQSIIASNPQHLDALIGLGQSLMAVGRMREASDALNRAESLAGEAAAVLAAQARLHANAGRTTLAVSYYERSLTLEPTSAIVRQEYQDVLAQRAHRVEVGYIFDHFNTDIPDPQAGFGGINARVSDSFRVSATVQHQRRFSISETRGGGGVEWMPSRSLRLHGGAMFGGDAAILPEVDTYGGLAYAVGRATWTFDLRIADFDQISVNIAGGGLRLALPQQGAVWAKYYRFDTDYQSARSDVVQSWVLGASGRITPGWTFGGEYTRGPDQLYLLTIDKTGPFEANTISVFSDFRLTPMLSIDARYDYQALPDTVDDDVSVHRGTFRLVQRF